MALILHFVKQIVLCYNLGDIYVNNFTWLNVSIYLPEIIGRSICL